MENTDGVKWTVVARVIPSIWEVTELSRTGVLFRNSLGAIVHRRCTIKRAWDTRLHKNPRAVLKAAFSLNCILHKVAEGS